MTIGIDGSRAFIKNRTGTENYAFKIIEGLANIDRSNTYHIFLHPKNKINFNKWPQNFKFRTIPYIRLWTQIGLGLETFKDRSLNLLFIPSHTLPIVKRPGLKTVITVHDLGAEYLPATHQLKQRLYLSFMTYHQLKQATRIIAVSNSTKRDLQDKIGLPSRKISVVYEGVDLNLFNKPEQSFNQKIIKKYKLEKDNYFLFVGTIQPRKNLLNLIRAYYLYIQKTNMPYKLVLAGSKGWKSDEIYSLPKELGIEDKVYFPGFIPESELSSLMSSAHAFLYPSLFEGFGLPILEAQACGCPVLTSNTSSMPEVAGETALLVKPNNPDLITKGMEQLDNLKIREKLINLGFKNVKKFSWQKAATETLNILLKTYNEKTTIMEKSG